MKPLKAISRGGRLCPPGSKKQEARRKKQEARSKKQEARSKKRETNNVEVFNLPFAICNLQFDLLLDEQQTNTNGEPCLALRGRN
jgi:regulator of replication initiation timing